MNKEIPMSRRTKESGGESRLRLLEALFNNGLDAILVADDEGRYVDANRPACALTGYDRGEILQLSVWDLTSPLNLELAKDLWCKFIAAGEQGG